VPRLAIQTLEVVSLIGAAARKRGQASDRATEQPELFPQEPGGSKRSRVNSNLQSAYGLGTSPQSFLKLLAMMDLGRA